MPTISSNEKAISIPIMEINEHSSNLDDSLYQKTVDAVQRISSNSFERLVNRTEDDEIKFYDNELNEAAANYRGYKNALSRYKQAKILVGCLSIAFIVSATLTIWYGVSSHD